MTFPLNQESQVIDNNLVSSRVSPLHPGERIALVAPSSPFNVEKFNQAYEMLKREGYHPVPGRHLLNRKKYLAGTEAQRAQDLIWAISDPSVAAVFCVRGGYGSGKLLPWLPFTTLGRTPKIFLGYSDITFLHLAFQSQMNWITFHGPNFIEAADTPDRLREILRFFRGESSFAWKSDGSHVIRHGVASGVLLGGNLTCLVHLIGTPFFPDLKGVLLLIEDRGEVLYRLDRLFTHLRLAGLLHQLGGLILGQFEDCGDPDDIWDMVWEQVKPFHFPVIANLPFGHGQKNQVIPLGILFSLNTYENVLDALQNPFSE
jgi:muramoyltetrapeptide carboxypeptidase